MLKIFGKTICKPLECILRECLITGLFPLERKKVNRVPVYKKGDKHCLKVSCSFIFTNLRQIFEKQIFN